MIRNITGCLIVMILTTTLVVTGATQPCNWHDVVYRAYDCYDFTRVAGTRLGPLNSGSALVNYFMSYCNDDSASMRQCFYVIIENCTNVEEIQEAHIQSHTQFCEGINARVLSYLENLQNQGVVFVPMRCMRRFHDLGCYEVIRQQVPELRPEYYDNFTVGLQKGSNLVSRYLNCTLTSDFYRDLSNLAGCEGVEPRNAILVFIILLIDNSAFAYGIDQQLIEQILEQTIPESDDPLGIAESINRF